LLIHMNTQNMQTHYTCISKRIPSLYERLYWCSLYNRMIAIKLAQWWNITPSIYRLNENI